MFCFDGCLNFQFPLVFDRKSKQQESPHQDYKGYNDAYLITDR